ncbi:MAG: hypothetical protein HY246_00895 [Proteobacteria bacterium]|nr:hypothetical protein [Pseudomonadota bacterium]
MHFRSALFVAALACTALTGISSLAQAQNRNLTITWGEDDNNARTFDPRVTSSRHESQVIAQVFDTLIGSDENNKLYPGLAMSWTVAPDGKSVTLKLREDVTFHDGTKFDAEAVKFTFDTVADPKLGSQGAIDLLGPYAGSDVLGPYEIRVNYKRPYGAALAGFAQNELSPVSPTAVKKLGDAGFSAAPVGAGPFKFVTWERGRQVLLERFDAYNWAPPFMKRQGPSYVAKVVHRFIPDASTRVAALESGEVDIADFTPVLDMRRLGDDKRYKTMIGNATGLPFGVMLNTDRMAFKDIRVRQAFAHAIDRPRLTQDMYFGLIDPAYGPLSKTTPGYWTGVEQYYKPDRNKAMQLLEEAGWKPGPGGIRVKDGQPLVANYYIIAPLLPEVGVAIQAELKRVGFDIKIETVSFARLSEIVGSNTHDILPLRWINADPSLLEIQFHSRNIPPPGVYRFNMARNNDPVLDQLLEKGGSLTDGPERTAAYADVQRRIMDAAIWFPIHNQVNPIAYRANRMGYRFARAQWIVRLYEVEEVR